MAGYGSNHGIYHLHQFIQYLNSNPAFSMPEIEEINDGVQAILNIFAGRLQLKTLVLPRLFPSSYRSRESPYYKMLRMLSYITECGFEFSGFIHMADHGIAAYNSMGGRYSWCSGDNGNMFRLDISTPHSVIAAVEPIHVASFIHDPRYKDILFPYPVPVQNTCPVIEHYPRMMQSYIAPSVQVSRHITTSVPAPRHTTPSVPIQGHTTPVAPTYEAVPLTMSPGQLDTKYPNGQWGTYLGERIYRVDDGYWQQHPHDANVFMFVAETIDDYIFVTTSNPYIDPFATFDLSRPNSPTTFLATLNQDSLSPPKLNCSASNSPLSLQRVVSVPKVPTTTKRSLQLLQPIQSESPQVSITTPTDIQHALMDTPKLQDEVMSVVPDSVFCKVSTGFKTKKNNGENTGTPETVAKRKKITPTTVAAAESVTLTTTPTTITDSPMTHATLPASPVPCVPQKSNGDSTPAKKKSAALMGLMQSIRDLYEFLDYFDLAV